MIMENKLRYVYVVAISDMGTRIQLAVSAETNDLRDLIVTSITKIAQYSSSSEEKFRIDHIDSTPHLPASEK